MWREEIPHSLRVNRDHGCRQGQWKGSLDGACLLACLFCEVWEPTGLARWETAGSWQSIATTGLNNFAILKTSKTFLAEKIKPRVKSPWWRLLRKLKLKEVSGLQTAACSNALLWLFLWICVNPFELRLTDYFLCTEVVISGLIIWKSAILCLRPFVWGKSGVLCFFSFWEN